MLDTVVEKLTLQCIEHMQHTVNSTAVCCIMGQHDSSNEHQMCVAPVSIRV